MSGTEGLTGLRVRRRGASSVSCHGASGHRSMATRTGNVEPAVAPSGQRTRTMAARAAAGGDAEQHAERHQRAGGERRGDRTLRAVHDNLGELVGAFSSGGASAAAPAAAASWRR